MTNEEAILWLNEELRTWENECQSKHPIKEALYVACKALEQKPCENAVSRTEVLNLVRFNSFHVKSQIKAIENMPSVIPQKPRWIPVAERLPNKSGRYLVSYESGYVGMVRYYESVSKWGCTTTERIVAWMPLPEPYKEDKEDGKDSN